MRKITLYITVTAILLLPILSTAAFPRKALAANVSLNPSSGSVGSTIQINATDFTGTYASIYWDDRLVAIDIPISTNGNFNYDLTIPSDCTGEHTILITDDSNWSGSTSSINFQVKPQITMFPTTAQEWSRIDIKGTGFRKNERDIRITWDDTVSLNPPATANKYGEWTTTFLIPNNSQGMHVIGAFGIDTKAEEVNKVDFIVVPWVMVTPTSGPVGTQLVIKGWGFRVNEDGITVTWDNEIIATNIRSEPDGSILLDGEVRTKDASSHDSVIREAIFVPPSTRGEHVVGVYGSSFTPIGVLPDTYFTVIPSLITEPASEYEGAEINISGAGFSPIETITLSYDEFILESDIITDSTGSFTALLSVPKSNITNHTISAHGSKGNSAQTEFISIYKADPLYAPLLLSPQNKTTLPVFNSAGEVIAGAFKYLFGVFAHIGGSSVKSQGVSTVFDWSDIDNLEDVKYTLQITSDDDFSSPIIDREINNMSEYTLTQEDLLTKGDYKWRTQAIDSEGNEGPWSEVYELKIISMPVRVIILTLIILFLFLAAIAFGVMIIYSRRTY
jgi:hypothetical protein